MTNSLSDDGQKWQVFELSANTLKTDLFTKITQLQRLTDELEHVMLLPKEKREDWIEENESLLGQFMDDMSDDSSLALEGMEGDDTEIELTVEFITQLRDVANMVQSILHGRRRMRS